MSGPAVTLDAASVAAIAAAILDQLPPAPLLTADQAGELLNVGASWVLAEARADRIPHIRLGRYVRFQQPALEAWWTARARGPRRTEVTHG